MNKNLELMVILQKSDNEIKGIEELLYTLPSLIEEYSLSLKEAKKEHEYFLKKIDEEKILRLEKEREVERKEEAIKKTNIKLHAIKTNQEYTAALKEIENFKKAISNLEDEQLELMESADKSREDESKLKQKVEEEDRKYSTVKLEKEAEISKLKYEKEIMVSHRGEILSKLEQEFASRYKRIFAVREGQVIAELKDGFCAVCHTMVLPQMALEIRMGTAVHNCPNCGRFLYVPKNETQKV